MRSDFTGSMLERMTSGDVLAAALVVAMVQALALFGLLIGGLS